MRCAIAFLLCALPGLSQNLDRVKQADTLFAAYGPNTPGCSVGVAQNGTTLLSKSYGTASLELPQALTTTSVFYMASIAKQFIAFSILLLEEDGKLKLDDAVRKYIPELPAYANGVTLRHLLHHTSGVRDFLTMGRLAGDSTDYVWTPRGLRDALARQKALNFAPGAEFLYSNTGYVLLSWVIEKVTGRRLNDWSQERIFKPLGMTSTRWQQDHSDVLPNRAIGHVPRDSGWRIANSMLDVVGDGGLYSTIEDMLRWNANYESPKIGTRALAQMQTPGKLGSGATIDPAYGMGLRMAPYRGLRTVYHGGNLGGYTAMYQRFPDQKFAAIVLCNNAGAEAARKAEQLAEVWLGDQMKEPRPAAAAKAAAGPVLSREQNPGLAGDFYSEELNAVTHIEDQSGQLVYVAGDWPQGPLTQ
ncbi:MAG: hypothetical protein RL328_2796, partial [Acidobacteriota bacterium]